jgi:hypothetical protein
MRFYLVYSGPLSGSGNKPKPDEVRTIRDQFHPQIELLWKTHPALKRLRWTARVAEDPAQFMGCVESPFEYDGEPTHPPQKGFIDLSAPISEGGKTYIPLVRKSLDLNCHLDILFLRQEDPGSLVLQGGDVDNRIKTLFDALRKPDTDVVQKYPQAQDPLYCLMESDTLISGFEVSTGRLLMPQTLKPNEVHLVIKVTVRVLKLGSWNVCLMGD